MSRCVLFCLLLTVARSDPSAPTDIEPSVLIVGVNSGTKDFSRWNIFKMENTSEQKDTEAAKPEIVELLSSSQITAVPSAQVGDVVNYNFGNRAQNDGLVGRGASDNKWTVPQDVTLSLKYPNSGQRAIVTYVAITVNQGSNNGNAKIIAGGIGQRSITIAIEAKSTMCISYTADIYGI